MEKLKLAVVGLGIAVLTMTLDVTVASAYSVFSPGGKGFCDDPVLVDYLTQRGDLYITAFNHGASCSSSFNEIKTETELDIQDFSILELRPDDYLCNPYQLQLDADYVDVTRVPRPSNDSCRAALWDGNQHGISIGVSEGKTNVLETYQRRSSPPSRNGSDGGVASGGCPNNGSSCDGQNPPGTGSG